MSILDFFGKALAPILGSVNDIIDTFVTTDEDKLKALKAKAEFELQFKRMQFEVEQQFFKDRQSARDMYMQDNGLQKIFAIVFLAGYLACTGFMVWMVFNMVNQIELPDWGIMFISSAFTAMSTKVNTIVDFLFGASKTKDDSEKAMAKKFEEMDSK